jgi:hypothetical protein
MNTLLNEKRLIIINLVIVSYFVALYLVNLFKIDFVLVGVFRELLTIPFLIGQIVFLIFDINFLVKQKRVRFFTLFSIVLLIISTFITIGSFFLSTP